jgi:hypothetical protein
MKPLHLFFGLSLVLNGFVVVICALRPGARAAIFGNPSEHTSVAEFRASAPASADTQTVATTAWTAADLSDFSRLRSRLEAAGFPPIIIRAVLATAVKEHFLAKERALLPKRSIPSEPWRNPRITAPASVEVRDAMRALNREQSRVLYEALGTEYSIVDEDQDAIARRRQRYGDLPVAKIVQLERIIADYADLTAQVRDESLGIMLPADYEKLAYLEREKRADLERLLTPAGLLDFELRSSPSASWVRGRLGQFEATEQEYRALYAVRKAFDEKYSPADGKVSPELARGRLAAEQALEDKFREVLGDARYAEYLRAKQPGLSETGEFGPSAQTIARIVTRLNLPPDTTASVVAVQSEMKRRASTVLADRALSSTARHAQLMGLSREAMTKITSLLGGPGFSAYQENGGRWINDLTRPPY